MHTATVAIDLAKTAFEVASADATGRVVERKRLSRSQLLPYFEGGTGAVPSRYPARLIAKPRKRLAHCARAP